MILTRAEILEEIRNGNIVIHPFDEKCLGPNSYDVHLGRHLAVYDADELDARRPMPVRYFEIPDEGYLLQPGRLYLGVTQEYTETHRHVPFLEGKSSAGRLGIFIHATAGKGDIGYCNTWTLEITVVHPVRIYAGMPIGQLIYFEVKGPIHSKYASRPGSKYTQRTDRPIPSMMWKNFQE